jgi:TnpA family transposase
MFTLDFLSDIELRRRIQAGLNKGEARNALARAVLFNLLGELRDRTYENQQYRTKALSLVHVLWSSRHPVSSGGGFGLLPEDPEKVI